MARGRSSAYPDIMARFFFHLHECGNITPDEDGVDRPDLESVRQDALKAVREVMCAEVREGRLCLSCHIEVLDADGTRVLMLPFKDAIEISGA